MARALWAVNEVEMEEVKAVKVQWLGDKLVADGGRWMHLRGNAGVIHPGTLESNID